MSTWMSMICPTRLSRARSGGGRRTTAAGLLAALLVAQILLVSGSVLADEPIRVLQSGVDYVFAESFTFDVRLESKAPLSDAILFFGRVGSPLVRRVYPEYRPAMRVDVRHVEAVEPGQFAPGTVFRFWWEFTDSEGQTLRTDTETFRYEDRRFDWEETAGETIDFYYYDGRDRQAERLLVAGEAAIERLIQEMGVPVRDRISVYSYASARDMDDALVLRSASYDDRVVTLGVVVDDHTLLLLGTHRDADLTIAHELSHVVVGIATDNPFIGVPRWLDEGLAMYAEGELPSTNQRALDRGIVDDSLLSLRSMTSYSGQADQVDLYYGQSYSVLAYMLDAYGRETMSDLLSAFSEGTRQDDALTRAYGFGLDELEDRWRASLGLE